MGYGSVEDSSEHRLLYIHLASEIPRGRRSRPGSWSWRRPGSLSSRSTFEKLSQPQWNAPRPAWSGS